MTKTTRTTAVMLATEAGDLGLVPANEARAKAREAATEAGKIVYRRDPTSDEVLGHAKPARKAAKGKGKTKRKAAGQPSGMVAEIIKLATRAKGVTPAELNELTEWKGAPWKWLFQNPKKTGYADRWGYRLKVVKDGRAVSYRLTKRAA